MSLDGVLRTQVWAPLVQRMIRAPVAHATHRFNLIPAVALSGLVAVMIQSETVKLVDFEHYLEHVLVSCFHSNLKDMSTNMNGVFELPVMS